MERSGMCAKGAVKGFHPHKISAHFAWALNHVGVGVQNLLPD